MRQAYLFAHHRQWLKEHPRHAFHTCLNSGETGWALFHRGDTREALGYLGSAYDAAELLLDSALHDECNALDWYVWALNRLITLLNHLGNEAQSLHCYDYALAKLAEYARSHPDKRDAASGHWLTLTAAQTALEEVLEEHNHRTAGERTAPGRLHCMH
jgi:tetratricopeptide (TPR) repeat protein